MAFCGNCGIALTDGDGFCRSCGAAAPPGVEEGLRPAGRAPGTGLNIALGVISAVLLVFFLLVLWASSTAQHNLDAWTGPAEGAPNPGAFGPPAVISIVAFAIVVVVLIVRLVRSHRDRGTEG